MQRPGAQGTDSQRGQSTVEFLGVIPAALLLALVAWHLVLAGQSAWLAARAARSAARAQAVGEDPARAARSAVPARLRSGMQVQAGGEAVIVRLGSVKARARLEGR